MTEIEEEARKGGGRRHPTQRSETVLEVTKRNETKRSVTEHTSEQCDVGPCASESVEAAEPEGANHICIGASFGRIKVNFLMRRIRRKDRSVNVAVSPV